MNTEKFNFEHYDNDAGRVQQIIKAYAYSKTAGVFMVERIEGLLQIEELPSAIRKYLQNTLKIVEEL